MEHAIMPEVSDTTLRHSHTIASATNGTPPRPDNGLSNQNRLLQLRNAIFQGPLLPGIRTSQVFASPPDVVDAFLRPFSSENSPRSSEQRRLYAEDLPPNSVNILQEIHNSTHRKRTSPRSDFKAIFQDNTATGRTSVERGRLGADNENNHCSPSHQDDMLLISNFRGTSRNERIAPPRPSTPCPQPIKERKIGPNQRSMGREDSEYTDYLEGQLREANTKLESFTAPAVSKARTAKIRSLTDDMRRLRQDLSDCENTSADRLKDQSDRHSGIEAGLRSRLRSLEKDLGLKDAKMRELQCELDNMQTRVKTAESLQAINLKLEKRIDILTSLLVISPTKLDHCSNTSSHSQADPLKGPRPRSMFSGLPLSPGAIQLSLNISTEGSSWDSRRFGSASSEPSSREDAAVSPISSLPPTRPMRRFPSGSCSLKPLILPTTHHFSPILDDPFDSEPRRPRPISLDKELEAALARSPDQFEDGLIPAANADANEEATFPPSSSETVAYLRQPVTPNRSSNIFKRLASWISRAKRDPIILARRILYNAWILGSARLSGMAWWLLGAGENPATRFNWDHFSAQANRARTAQCYLQGQVVNGKYTNAPTQSSHRPPVPITSYPSRPTSNNTTLAIPPHSIPASNTIITNATVFPSPSHEPYRFACHDCHEPPSSYSTFRLWFHFSLAIVLAVGVAIKQGPGVVLFGTPLSRPDLLPRQPEAESAAPHQ